MIEEESKLIAAYLSGDEKSLEVLINGYLKPVYSFVYRRVSNAAEAEDITQEIFVKVWRNLSRFDRSKSFKSWLFTIAKNTLVDFYRKRRDIPFVEFENEDGENALFEKLIDANAFSIGKLETAESGAELRSAIGKLPPADQQIVNLKYQKEFTFEEISRKLGRSINTVKSQYRRALIKLKNILTENT